MGWVRANVYFKHIRNSCSLSDNKVVVLLQLFILKYEDPTHIDILLEYRWFVTFIDCCTRVTWVVSANGQKWGLLSFHKIIWTQFDVKIKILQTNNDTWYRDKRFGVYVKFNEIIHHTSCHYTKTHNGVANRKNWH